MRHAEILETDDDLRDMGLARPKQPKMSGEDADAPPPPPPQPPPPPPPDIVPSEQDTESLFEATPAEPQATPAEVETETSGPSTGPAASIAEDILCK